jgi:hypothetical protein
MYSTVSKPLTSLAPTNESQYGLNEEKTLIERKIISQLSVSDVTGVVSLDTNNQAHSWECQQHVGGMSATCQNVPNFELTCVLVPTQK